jgi:oligopeptidase B
MKGRIKEADVGVPERRNGYWYYDRTLEGSQYVVHTRRRAGDGRAALVETSGPDLTKNSREEVLLDENKRKEEGGFKFYAVRRFSRGFSCRGRGQGLFGFTFLSRHWRGNGLRI